MPDEDEEVSYDLVMPFVVCASQGGPFDDAAFTAGYEMGRLDGLLTRTDIQRWTETIRTPNVPQAELLAMKHGLQMESRPDPVYGEEWSHVRFTRDPRYFDGGDGA